MNLHSEKSWHAVDGIVDENLFNKQRLRILWILREPNGGDFNFMEYLNDVTAYPRWKQSYGLIVKVSRIILDELFTDEDEWYSYDPKVMKRIALINIKNTEGKSSVNWDEITESFNSNKDSLAKRLNDIRSDLIFCGGTYGYIRKLNIDTCPVIDLYHPNQRKITHREYIKKAIQQYMGTTIAC